ncbi:MAG: 16S rRNA (cytidine(1402)-2'-O)-methyltransferase [Candidatus Aminicenantes bacterium]|jgi:16S rRNA (cytidine1402-2'-O)-methyltransferase
MNKPGGTDRNRSFGRLFIVGTPIGNLEDLTFRALKVLEDVPVIACEDTRQTRKLLSRYKLTKKLISYFHPKEMQKLPRIIKLIKEGNDVALVSDAGTPGISDPGFPLIREAINQGIHISVIPGVSALTAALSGGGLPTHRFIFLGFAPSKKTAAKKLLESLKQETATLVFFLPPRKLLPFLQEIKDTLGDRQVVIAREMTKIYEEFLRGTPEELMDRIDERILRGEATVLIQGKPKA